MSELNEEESKVIEECGTEPRFSSDLLDIDKEGVFKCKKCGKTLFSSKHKYDSGTGWPSFYDVLNAENIEKREDNSKATKRTEIVCSNCEAHLGHLFNDGPQDKTGKRYCINGLALEFDPNDK